MVSTRNLSRQNDDSNKKTRRRLKAKNNKVPVPIREKIIDLTVKKGHMSVSATARFFDLPRSTVVDNIKDNFVNTGEIVPKARGGRRPERVKITEDHSKFLIELLDENCTLTFGMMREKLYENFDDTIGEKGITPSSICRHITEEIGFTLKRTKPVEEKRNDPRTIDLRKKFVESLPGLGRSYKTNCIFVDKAGFNVNLIRQEGWSRKGENSVVRTKTKRSLNVTILSA